MALSFCFTAEFWLLKHLLYLFLISNTQNWELANNLGGHHLQKVCSHLRFLKFRLLKDQLFSSSEAVSDSLVQ